MPKFPLSLRCLLLPLLAPVVVLSAQEGVPAPPGLVPAKMWPAPTAEDWAKPVLIQWQRTWEDAVALSRQTKRPILVCVNMDGEIASEHYAGVRYRQPEITRLYEPYVCVIASVYRHNPRDYDESGQRIPCPRFGGVTCGEHIALEPVVYEQFLDGKRIAPRHIMVELDGKEVYDVFYMWDTDSVFNAIRNGIEQRAIQPEPIVKGDRSLLERVASKDSVDRMAVEQAWSQGDAALRRSLLEAALQQGGDVPVELLRLAIHGFDLEQAKRARAGLVQANGDSAVELMADTLRMPVAAEERQALVRSLRRLGGTSNKARMLATVHEGLAGQSSPVDVEGWSRGFAGATYAPADPSVVAAQLDALDQSGRSRAADPTAQVEVAEATLLLALEHAARPVGPGSSRVARQYDRLLFEDAQRAAAEAVRLGATGWRVEAVQALVAQRLGQHEAAYGHAEKAAAGMPPDAPGRIAAGVLALFAEARQEAIVAKAKQKEDWPPQWTTDVHAAYSVLARHPFGTDRQVANHYDFLQFFGTAQATVVLDEGLKRFPDSALLHERLRNRVLAERSPQALEAEYAQRLAASGDAPPLLWFSGYASMVAAEARRRARQGDEALSTYDRGIALFDRYVAAAPDGAGGAHHYAAMAHAGKAHVLMQQGKLDAAVDEIEAAFRRWQDAAASLDGLGFSAVETAKLLRTKVEEKELPELARRLDAALAALPPELLLPPEFERVPQRGAAPGRRRRG